MAVAARKIVIGIVALAVAAGAAYAGYGVWQKRKLQAQVSQLVAVAGGRLEATLGIDINAASADLPPKLDKAIQEVESGLNELRAANARPDRPLIEAADDYVAGVLAVLRRQAGSTRGRLKFNESHKVLSAHLAQVGQRGSNWMPEAIRLRRALDKDYFDYQIAATSLGNMLGGYPQSRKRIAALLPAASLPADAAVKEAHMRALGAAEATKQQYEKAKQLIAPG